MHPDPRAALASRAAELLPEVVRAALEEPSAVLGEWDVVPLRGGFGASGVDLFQGVARVGVAARRWRVVLKVLAPQPERDDPSQIYYWRREALLFASGVLDRLPTGLRAPRCYGRDQARDGAEWLWLEHVHEVGEPAWPFARWALAARHLGLLNGAYAAPASDLPLPDLPWLGGGRLRSWLGRHARLVEQIAAAADDPAVRVWWPRPVVDGVLRLWEERETLLGPLEALPQTFCHGDAIRRNLLAHRAPDGTEETVAIDWEFAGRMAVGEEVGQTLSVAAAFFHVDPGDLPALDEALFAAYLDGLRAVGWRGDPRPVRFAYAAHAALRNGFNAVGTTVPDAARRAAVVEGQGRTWEELAERRAAIRPFLLALADEARALVSAL